MEDKTVRTFTLDHLNVTPSEVFLCHFNGLPVNQALVDRYRRALAHANSLLKPVAGAELITNYMFNDLMRSIKDLSSKTHAKLRPLQESSMATHLVFCTIGPHLDEEVERRCAADDVSEAFILDAIGSIAVVKYARYVEMLLAEEAALQGYKCSAPVMPGTRGIDLVVNEALAEMVDLEQIGISLSKQCIMKPLKTVAMMLGVGGDRLTVGEAGHDCSDCSSEKTCHLKNIRNALDTLPFSGGGRET